MKININQDLSIILVIVLIALIFFGIGRLTSPKSEPVQIINLDRASIEDINFEEKVYPPTIEQSDLGRVVGSINSDKYHLPECSGAKQISEKNIVWFDSIDDAKKAGYKPAGNCPGLK